MEELALNITHQAALNCSQVLQHVEGQLHSTLEAVAFSVVAEAHYFDRYCKCFKTTTAALNTHTLRGARSTDFKRTHIFSLHRQATPPRPTPKSVCLFLPFSYRKLEQSSNSAST